MDKGLKKNEIHRVRVESCDREGSGVARIRGQVVFVKGALAGELCDIHILKAGKSVAFAKVERLLEPSPERREPECPHFGRCGGCSFWHMSYAEELVQKRRGVEEVLRRIGGADLPVEEILGADSVLSYRNKAQYPVGPGEDGPLIGFYRARSHQVIPVERCLIQHPLADRAAGEVGKYLREEKVSAYDEVTGRGLLRHVYARVNEQEELLLCLVVNGDKLPKEQELVRRLREACPSLVGVVLNRNTAATNVILGRESRLLWGQDYLETELFGNSFRLSVPSFFQVNRAQMLRLYETALDFAALEGEETVLDLYCGIGTITLSLAQKAGRVIGAEIVPEAVEDARENARRNGVDNAEFFCGDAGDIARQLEREGIRPRVAVVDPPRKGLSEEAVSALCGMEPQRVVYVSCDPATLARDVKRFAQLGYRAVRAKAVDLFPRTAHVETVCLMSRVEGK